MFPRHHFLLRNLEEASDYAKATLAILDYCADGYPHIEACQYATCSAVARVLNQPKLARENGEKSFRINSEIYKTSGVITSQIVASYTELGRVMIMDNELEEAERLIKESARLRRQMPHFSRLQLFSPILFFSYIENLRGQFKQAEKHLLEALRDRELEYGKDDRESDR